MRGAVDESFGQRRARRGTGRWAEFADELNDVIEDFTGRRGDVTPRTVRHWLTGER